MKSIIYKSKELFYKMVEDFGSDPYLLLSHVPKAEKWVKFLLRKHPEADEEVVILVVWLHDIGHYPIQTDKDHAVTGEAIAKEFLIKEKFDSEKTAKVLHCIRAHRCKDVMPQTIEAKIIACADSASHMTDVIYLDMVEKKIDNALAKLERDFRDLSYFPELKEQLNELYNSWKNLTNFVAQENPPILVGGLN